MNVWRHVAVTLNGSVGILYVNGVAVGTNPSMTLKPSSLGNTTQNYIGKSQYPDPYFEGLVDEFRIYSGALNASEVLTFITPLTAPTNFTATATNTQVALKWNAVTRATGYNVMRSLTNGGTYAFVANVTTTNYTNAALISGTTYYYVVTAMNAVGESTNSAQVSATLPAPPDSPTGLVATAGDAQVFLTWNAAAGANAYNVKRAAGSGGSFTVIAPNIAGLAFTNGGLVNGTVYYYIVSATNAVGESADSDEASARPVSATPPQMSVGNLSGQIQIGWRTTHTGWRLEAQTNSMNTGLGTNWVTVFGTIATNLMLIPISSTNGSVFFRLIFP